MFDKWGSLSAKEENNDGRCFIFLDTPPAQTPSSFPVKQRWCSSLTYADIYPNRRPYVLNVTVATLAAFTVVSPREYSCFVIDSLVSKNLEFTSDSKSNCPVVDRRIESTASLD